MVLLIGSKSPSGKMYRSMKVGAAPGVSGSVGTVAMALLSRRPSGRSRPCNRAV